MVRCSRCGHEWLQEPEDGDADTLDEALDDIEFSALDEESGLLSEEPEDGADEDELAAFDQDEAVEAGDLEEPDDPDDPDSVSREFSLDEMMAEGEDSAEALDEALDEVETEDGVADVDDAAPVDVDEAEADSAPEVEAEAENEAEIPDSIRPQRESPDSTVQDVVLDPEEARRRMIAGFGGAAGLFVLIFIVLLGLKGVLVKSWPASMAFYNALGMTTAAPGEGLLFERVNAIFAQDLYGGEVINLSGKIVNLTDEAVSFPALKVDFEDKDGHVSESRSVAVEHHEIGPHDHLLVEEKLKTIPEGTKAVRLYFAADLDGADHQEGHADAGHDAAPADHSADHGAHEEDPHAAAPADHGGHH